MKKLLAVLILFFGLNSITAAQDQTQLNPWSIDLKAGFLTGNQTSYLNPFVGSLGVESEIFNPHLGLSLRYSFSTALALQANFGWARLVEDQDTQQNNPYTSELYMGSLQGTIYFLRAFEFYRTSRYVNPYIYLGVGRTFGQVTDLPGGQEVSLNNGFIHGGIGTKVYLTDRVDLLFQYEYHAYRATNIDGYRNIEGPQIGSRLGGLTLGVSVKLGSSDRGHRNWHLGDSRFERVDTVAEEIRDEQSSMRREVNRSLNSQDDRLASMERRVETLEERSPARADEETRELIENLRDRVANLENEIESMKADPARPMQRRDRADISVDVPGGFYVQVFAGAQEKNSQGALEVVRELFEEVHEMRDLEYVIHRPGNYYVVQIGPYSRYSDTREILQRAREVFDDSFVLRYK